MRRVRLRSDLDRPQDHTPIEKYQQEQQDTTQAQKIHTNCSTGTHNSQRTTVDDHLTVGSHRNGAFLAAFSGRPVGKCASYPTAKRYLCLRGRHVFQSPFGVLWYVSYYLAVSVSSFPSPSPSCPVSIFSRPLFSSYFCVFECAQAARPLIMPHREPRKRRRASVDRNKRYGERIMGMGIWEGE